MAKKIIRLTEQEFYEHITSIVESVMGEIDGKTHARVPNATTKARQLNQQGKYQTSVNGSNGTKTIDHNNVISKYSGTLQRANQSLLAPFIATPFIFYATDRFGGSRFLTFKISNIKKLMNGIAILSGDVVFDGNQMIGDISVDFNKQVVQYRERGTRYKYNLEIDNRTKANWDNLLSELKASLDNRI